MRAEVTNAIRQKIRRDQISQTEGDLAMQVFESFPIHAYDLPRLSSRAFALATQYDRPAAYDSHYVALAEAFECDFWTADDGIVNVMARDMPYVKALKDYS